MAKHEQLDPARWLDQPWDGLHLHYHEIALKRGTRPRFLRVLRENLAAVLRPLGLAVHRLSDRFYIPLPPDAAMLQAALERTTRVCGIQSVVPVRRLPPDLAALSAAAVEAYRALAADGATSFAIDARRSSKRFAHTSQEIMQAVGAAVSDATGASVNLSHPGVLIRFRVFGNQPCLVGPVFPGPGGLPVGVSGRVLALLSGGIDSPVAAWMMMSRGCTTHFLHFHVFARGEEVIDTKMPETVRRLLEPQGHSARVFLVPYHPFQMQLLQAEVPPALELILFRRFMVRVADALAEQHAYSALVTGDNLGQVASQTMENLVAMDDAVNRPIFRPLLGLHKPAIIELAEKLQTFALANEPYKDCCSIVARHPKTQPRLETVQEAELALRVESMLQEALRDTEEWSVDREGFRPVTASALSA